MKRLDDVFADSRLRLVKVAAQGMELEALRGAQRTLETFRPALYVENDRLAKSALLIEFLWSCRYRIWWHTPRLFADNFFGNKENVFGDIRSFNVLCLPR